MDHDSLSDTGWMRPDQFAETFGDKYHSHVTSCGFPVWEDDVCLVLALNLGDDGKAADFMRIMKNAIVSIHGANGRKVTWDVGKGRKIFRYEHDKPK